MPLPRCPNATLAYHCPDCGTARVNSGQWFRAIGSYKCGGCNNLVRVTYEDKVKLFTRADEQPDAGARRSVKAHRSLPLGEVLELRTQGQSWREVSCTINERHREDWHGESLMEAVARLQRKQKP
jgi:hypothetical protein